MLINFQFSNFRSFCDSQTLSFEATSLKGRNSCIFQTSPSRGTGVLPICLVMGSNASGKSNLLKALDYLRTQVLTSYSKTVPKPEQTNTGRESFSLNTKAQRRPSVFEITFSQDDTQYKYGFSCDDHKFIEEWMYAYPHGQQQKWFQRKNDDYKFGKSFLGEKKALAEITPEDSLFLSVGLRSKHEQLEKVLPFFLDMQFDFSREVSSAEISSRIKDQKIDVRVIEFLRLLDTGIYGYKIQPKRVSGNDEIFQEELEKFIKSVIGRTKAEAASDQLEESSEESLEDFDLNDLLKSQLQIYFKHIGADEDCVGIPFRDESDGTKRLLRLVQDAFKALDNGDLMVVDEIDASLHTRACELFLGLFLTPELNTNGAQLLATSHNTNLLSSEEIRRDEIWFVEKQINGQSNFYSAAEFKMRAERNLEVAYLDDRFGALPSKIDPRLLVVNND